MALEIKAVPRSDVKPKVKAPTYPYLAEGLVTGVIVLFTKACTGVVLQEGSPSRSYLGLGVIATNLDEHRFRPFYGKLSMTQEKEYA